MWVPRAVHPCREHLSLSCPGDEWFTLGPRLATGKSILPSEITCMLETAEGSGSGGSFWKRLPLSSPPSLPQAECAPEWASALPWPSIHLAQREYKPGCGWEQPSTTELKQRRSPAGVYPVSNTSLLQTHLYSSRRLFWLERNASSSLELQIIWVESSRHDILIMFERMYLFIQRVFLNRKKLPDMYLCLIEVANSECTACFVSSSHSHLPCRRKIQILIPYTHPCNHSLPW